MAPGSKFDRSQALRDEIERRTTAGETCAQIALALTAQGFNVSDKTISRRRVEWGFRKRQSPTTKGTIRPNLSRPRPPRPEDADADSTPLVGKKQFRVRRTEITERTQRGETAEQIFEALTAQGVSIRKGPSTILRLQTFWGLIPYDTERANGRGPYRKKRASGSGAKSTDAARRPDQTAAVHYPASCRFGPRPSARTLDAPSQQLANEISGRSPVHIQQESTDQNIRLDLDDDNIDPGLDLDMAGDMDSDSVPENKDIFSHDAIDEGIAEHQMHVNGVAAPLEAQQAYPPPPDFPIDIAAEWTRAEAIVGLSNSVLPVATELKRVLSMIRSRRGRLHPGSTREAIVNGKLKIRQAAEAIVAMTYE